MKKYLRLKHHIHAVQFQDDLIVLDLKQDQYYILDAQKSQLLKLALAVPWVQESDGHFTSKTGAEALAQKFMQILQGKNWLEAKLYARPNADFSVSKAAGVEELDWHLPLDETFKVPLSWQLGKAYFTLLKVHMLVKLKGFYGLVRYIRKSRRSNQAYSLPSQAELDLLVNTLNKACLLYPVRTKCLEWSATLTLLSLQKGWSCRLNIGVQNYPFLAHAWASIGGEVIADAPTLPTNMAVILSLPEGRPQC